MAMMQQLGQQGLGAAAEAGGEIAGQDIAANLA